MTTSPTNCVTSASSDLDPVLEENSNMYISERDAFFENDRRPTSRPRVWRMDPLEAVDIDEETNFTLAEQLSRDFFD